LRNDAKFLFKNGDFTPDGLTNTALSKEKQGFTGKADRQTFRGGADWESDVGDLQARTEFKNRMTKLREQLALELNRPSLKKDGEKRHEMTYNWYEPGAKLGRHLDEHHEETKGMKGWLLDSRRSVTWLVYLNSGWEEKDGGALRCFPRDGISSQPVGSHEGNLQIGWLDHLEPIYLDCFRKSGMSALYRVVDDKREVLTQQDFDVPRQPIEFVSFLPDQYKDRFEQISTARLDPRFAAKESNIEKECQVAQASLLPDKEDVYTIDVVPKAGTLVLFDSVSLPHLVQEVTSTRQRIAATGWFHEDSEFVFEA
jgi:Rps23 Pro-64 3,4-dihydroxylase Tpa1-like proline 4-hydroxylase